MLIKSELEARADWWFGIVEVRAIDPTHERERAAIEQSTLGQESSSSSFACSYSKKRGTEQCGEAREAREQVVHDKQEAGDEEAENYVHLQTSSPYCTVLYCRCTSRNKRRSA